MLFEGWITVCDADPALGNSQRLAPAMRDISPRLVYCWYTVCNADPTLNQHWFNVSRACWHTCNYGCTRLGDVITQQARGVGPMLGLTFDHRLRRWPNFSPTPCVCWEFNTQDNSIRWFISSDNALLKQREVPAYFLSISTQQTQNIFITSIQRRPNVFEVGPTLVEQML